jgi:hypothetical protein
MRNLFVWIKDFGIEFHYFPVNVLIGSRDNGTFPPASPEPARHSPEAKPMAGRPIPYVHF